MTRVVKFVALAAVLAALLLAATACGEEQTTEEAKQQLITDLEAYDAAVEKMRSLPAEATVDQWKSARDEAQKAWDKVVESAADVSEAQIGNVQSAWDELAKAVDDLPGDATVTEAAASLKPYLESVRAAYDDLYNGL